MANPIVEAVEKVNELVTEERRINDERYEAFEGLLRLTTKPALKSLTSSLSVLARTSQRLRSTARKWSAKRSS